jgi:tRNA (mo5U34)-methyltransferase
MTEPRAACSVETSAHLRETIKTLGPWFHNLQVKHIPTAPDHFLGDFPRIKWTRFAATIPADLTGLTVLDIGCNGGFYAQEMKKRGAARVLGIDCDERYLRQARFAAEANGFDIEFRKTSVYELDALTETFDIVLFLGVFYHLRYPLYALDKVVQKVRRYLLFQSLIRPFPKGTESPARADEYAFWEQAVFEQKLDFPRMHFIERGFADDPTNWWLPNIACAEAMLRSTGLEILSRPEEETWWCAPTATRRNGRFLQQAELSGEVWG